MSPEIKDLIEAKIREHLIAQGNLSSLMRQRRRSDEVSLFLWS